MNNERDVVLVSDSVVVLEGAGVPVRRIVPNQQISYGLVDPILLLDEGKLKIDKDAPNFPEHPHRGFEIVTYVLKGTIHQVQRTHSGEDYAEVREGGLLRITAGRGMSHGEGVGKSGETEVHILQLWINLPRLEKGMAPSFQVVEAKEIPLIQKDNVTIRTLVGENSPTELVTPTVYYDVRFDRPGDFSLGLPELYQGIIYVLQGSGTFGISNKHMSESQVGVLSDTGTLTMTCAKGTHILVCAGAPIHEAPRWYGPFVD